MYVHTHTHHTKCINLPRSQLARLCSGALSLWFVILFNYIVAATITHVSSVLIVDFSRKICSNKKKSRNDYLIIPQKNTWLNKIMRMTTSRNDKWRITFTNTLTRCIPNTWNEKVLHNQRSAFPSSENAHFPACCSDHFVNSSDICPAVLVLIM